MYSLAPFKIGIANLGSKSKRLIETPEKYSEQVSKSIQNSHKHSVRVSEWISNFKPVYLPLLTAMITYTFLEQISNSSTPSEVRKNSNSQVVEIEFSAKIRADPQPPQGKESHESWSNWFKRSRITPVVRAHHLCLWRSVACWNLLRDVFGGCQICLEIQPRFQCGFLQLSNSSERQRDLRLFMKLVKWTFSGTQIGFDDSCRFWVHFRGTLPNL